MKQYLAHYRWRTTAGELMDTVRPITTTSKAEAVRIAKQGEGQEEMTWYVGIDEPREANWNPRGKSLAPREGGRREP